MSLASVSVIIPCYNYARYLPAAIVSCLEQVNADVQVIVVDDCSTDDSVAVATGFAARESRVQVHCHSTNAGPVATFNDGLPFVKGEFLVRLDADDLLTPGSLDRAVDVMRAYPNVGLVYGHPLHFAGDSLPLAREQATHWTIWNGAAWLRDRCLDGWNVITSPEVLMRTSVVHQTGGQKSLPHTHDMEMWMRLAAYGDIAYIHGSDQAWHRDHAASLSARHVDTMRDLIERRLAFDTLLLETSHPILNPSELHELARRALANEALEFACREVDRGQGTSPLIQEYVSFARATFPDVRSLTNWRAISSRLERPKPAARWHPVGLISGLRRRWRWQARQRRWHECGVY